MRLAPMQVAYRPLPAFRIQTEPHEPGRRRPATRTPFRGPGPAARARPQPR